jgi:hypothetical protein
LIPFPYFSFSAHVIISQTLNSYNFVFSFEELRGRRRVWEEEEDDRCTGYGETSTEEEDALVGFEVGVVDVAHAEGD